MDLSVPNHTSCMTVLSSLDTAEYATPLLKAKRKQHNL